MLTSEERRRHRRSIMSVPAEVLAGGRRRSFAWLKDLSESGAQLRSAVRLAPGARVELILHPPGLPVLTVTGTILESSAGERSYSARLALEAPGPDGREALATILHASPRAGVAPQDRAVLIIMDDTEARHALAQEVAALGQRPVTVSTPLAAIAWLQDTTAIIDAVVATDRYVDLPAFFAFLEDSSPSSRRVLAIEGPAPRRPPLSEATHLVDAVVALPADPAALGAALSSEHERASGED